MSGPLRQWSSSTPTCSAPTATGATGWSWPVGPPGGASPWSWSRRLSDRPLPARRPLLPGRGRGRPPGPGGRGPGGRRRRWPGRWTTGRWCWPSAPGYQIVGRSLPGGRRRGPPGAGPARRDHGQGHRAPGGGRGAGRADGPGPGARPAPTLTGFENHGGVTTVGPGAPPRWPGWWPGWATAPATAPRGPGRAGWSAPTSTARSWPATRPWPTCCLAWAHGTGPGSVPRRRRGAGAAGRAAGARSRRDPGPGPPARPSGVRRLGPRCGGPSRRRAGPDGPDRQRPAESAAGASRPGRPGRSWAAGGRGPRPGATATASGPRGEGLVPGGRPSAGRPPVGGHLVGQQGHGPLDPGAEAPGVLALVGRQGRAEDHGDRGPPEHRRARFSVPEPPAAALGAVATLGQRRGGCRGCRPAPPGGRCGGPGRRRRPGRAGPTRRASGRPRGR